VHHSHEYMRSNDYAMMQSLPWWWSGPAPSTPQQNLIQLLHIMDLRMVDLLLKDTPDTAVHQIKFWRIWWPHLWEDELWRDSVTCTIKEYLSRVAARVETDAEKTSRDRKLKCHKHLGRVKYWFRVWHFLHQWV